MYFVKKLVLILFVIGAIVSLADISTWAAFQKATKPAAPKPAAPAPTAPDKPATNSATPDTTGKYAAIFDHMAKTEEGKRKAHDVLTTQENCEKCHTRKDDKPIPPRPYHDSCIKCHTKQFTDPKLEICAGCHTRPYTEEPKEIVFPKKLNQFGMEFSHATHQARKDFNCETCHATPADGKTARSSYPDHPECYTCHKAVNQPAKGNCNECHKIGLGAEKFRTRGQVNFAYEYFNFNHGKHLIQATSCEQCHDVSSTDTDNKKTDVSRIVLVLSKDPNKYHRAKCFDCHKKDGNDAKGNADCKRCHVKEAVPGDLIANPPKQYTNYIRP